MPKYGLASTFTQGAGVVLPGAVVMTYSRPSGVNPPRPLKKIRSSRGAVAVGGRFGAMRPGRCQTRDHGLLHAAAAADLFRERAAAVGDDGAGDRLEQNAVLARISGRRADEDAARPVHDVGFDAGGNQTHDLVLQMLPVTGVSSFQITRSTASPFRRQ